jgi:hypothetical protein
MTAVCIVWRCTRPAVFAGDSPLCDQHGGYGSDVDNPDPVTVAEVAAVADLYGGRGLTVHDVALAHGLTDAEVMALL